ncbi:hypothetical protein B0H10DRAFT_547322 [Mycena sp. CBHHK59/15]|nr:hypothetical protein B0H10DRAFT_547322 [Mycena sp. CBHHK59/15]
MLSKVLSFALCVLSAVQVSPNPIGSSNANVLARQNPVAVKIVNVGNGGSTFTFTGSTSLEVLIQQGVVDRDGAVWEKYMIGADKYTFKNAETGYWISVGGEGHLFTDSSVNATVFAVESAGGGEFVIKAPYADQVWQTFYDGTSPIYLRVVMQPADGGSDQRWTFV